MSALESARRSLADAQHRGDKCATVEVDALAYVIEMAEAHQNRRVLAHLATVQRSNRT